MMISKENLVEAICKKIGITREEPGKDNLSKKELTLLWSWLNLIPAPLVRKDEVNETEQ